MHDAPPSSRLTIAFDAGHLNERGTDVALFDYALGTEQVLGHRVLVLCPAHADITCLDRFRALFPVYLYRSRRDLAELLRPVDAYYRIDSGERPAIQPLRPPNGRLLVHCVFRADQPHGDVYAAVSDWVAQHRGDGITAVPVVPHMVHLPPAQGDLRAELGIPSDAAVLGRHGGRSTFNIGFAQQAVAMALRQREDLWFVFLNTAPFLDHPRVHWLPPTSDLCRKRAFIETCDAMLHARAEGETFGLSVAEFSICNKPVLTFRGGLDQHHLDVLGDKGIYYRDRGELLQLLLSLPHRPVGDFDAFSSRFSPGVVMRRFDEVFLEDPSDRGAGQTVATSLPPCMV